MVFRLLRTPQFVENALQQYNYDCSTCFVHYYRREKETERENKTSLASSERIERKEKQKHEPENQTKIKCADTVKYPKHINHQYKQYIAQSINILLFQIIDVDRFVMQKRPYFIVAPIVIGLS